MKDRQYYINLHKELYDECLVEAGMENANDVTAGADTLYNVAATAEHIVGYYLFWYGDEAMKIWNNNLSYFVSRRESGTEEDYEKEVSQILKELFGIE